MKKVFAVGLKTVGGLASVSGLALLVGPALAGIGFVVIVVAGALCWIVADSKRTTRLATLIGSVRGIQRPPRQQSPQRHPADSAGPKTAGEIQHARCSSESTASYLQDREAELPLHRDDLRPVVHHRGHLVTATQSPAQVQVFVTWGGMNTAGSPAADAR
jgi:hypothetical protein